MFSPHNILPIPIHIHAHPLLYRSFASSRSLFVVRPNLVCAREKRRESKDNGNESGLGYRKIQRPEISTHAKYHAPCLRISFFKTAISIRPFLSPYIFDSISPSPLTDKHPQFLPPTATITEETASCVSFTSLVLQKPFPPEDMEQPAVASQPKLPAGLAGVLNTPDTNRDSAYYSITDASSKRLSPSSPLLSHCLALSCNFASFRLHWRVSLWCRF